MSGYGHQAWCAAAVVSTVCLLPFLPGLLAGHRFYFRDLARQFLPARLFASWGSASAGGPPGPTATSSTRSR